MCATQRNKIGIIAAAAGLIIVLVAAFLALRPNPVVKESEGSTHYQMIRGVWGEAKVTVENKGGSGDVIVWARWTSGDLNYKGETKVHMEAGESLIVTIEVPISDNEADYDLTWQYECGARV